MIADFGLRIERGLAARRGGVGMMEYWVGWGVGIHIISVFQRSDLPMGSLLSVSVGQEAD
jgi:hypothetical protein